MGATLGLVPRALGTVGCTSQARRRGVERTFGWLGRERRLAKAYEAYPEGSEAGSVLVPSQIRLRRRAVAT